MELISKKIKILLLLFLPGLILGCQVKQATESEDTKAQNKVVQTIRMEIIPAPNNTFGYNILKNGKVFIHQPHIPAVAGNKGFSTEAKARKAAAFAISKIEKNIIPPTITAAELDSLGVLD